MATPDKSSEKGLNNEINEFLGAEDKINPQGKDDGEDDGGKKMEEKELMSFKKSRFEVLGKIGAYLFVLGIGFAGGTCLDLDDRGKNTTSSKTPGITAENDGEKKVEKPKNDEDADGKNQGAKKKPSLAELKKRAEDRKKRLEALK